MQYRKFLISALAILMVCALSLPSNLTSAANPPGQDKLNRKGQITVEEQLAAGQAFVLALPADLGPGIAQPPASETHIIDPETGRLIPHYFGPYPNYALSPLPAFDDLGNQIAGIRKFVDSMPGLTPANQNNLGQYIPVAVPDTTTYATADQFDADYYEIALVEFREQMHSDLPASGTKHRGYVQLDTSVIPGDGVPLFDPDTGMPILLPNGTQAIAVDEPHYMGPAIIAQRDRPVRIKFYNLLPTGEAGNLFIPVDTTVMGAGMGPVMDDVTNQPIDYTQNRATLHLHGGITPWISDGTPHQWITPANEETPYPQGVSVYPVPDMETVPQTEADRTDGVMTFYYTNEQSARLMFYHDHAFGITRLNVYAGEAAAYLIQDEVEAELVTNGVIPSEQIAMVIQDKTFVPDPTVPYSNIFGDWVSQNDFYDPTWDSTVWGDFGNLWYPHVYMPVQNPYDPSGINAFGRWHYGPWFWPPVSPVQGPIANPYYDPANPTVMEPEMVPGVPLDSMGMESFFDTPLVNGTAYPYLEVDPTSYRLRILNAANDRFWNLQLYIADPDVITVDGRTNTEVRMVPAALDTGLPQTEAGYGTGNWPADGREGGVPDPSMAGPAFIQIGNEGGFLPEPVVLEQTPVSWNLDATTFNAGLVNGGTLVLGPAERADVIVDFSQYAGKTLLLYNDAPAPWPAWTPQYDYYTGSPDLTDTGGAPGTIAGYGPNTRTIMQIRVGGGGDMGVGSVGISSGGTGYTSPVVEFIGGSPSVPADATATGSIDKISLSNLGSGYTSPQVVIADPPAGGVTATATASVFAGHIVRINVVNPGSGYITAPAVTINDPVGTGAAARATMKVTAVAVNDNGSGYVTVPAVVIHEANNLGDGAGTLLSAALVSSSPLPAFDIGPLIEAFTPTDPTVDGVFVRDQKEIIVGQAAYNNVYDRAFPDTLPAWGISGIADNTLTFETVSDGIITMPMQAKAIQDEMGEAFDTEFGRMSGFLGVELPVTIAGQQAFTLYPFLSPPVEVIGASVYSTLIGTQGDGTQIWKITHNGVDTHPVHWHMFEVQLINRVAWDNAISLPEANEMGWKDTIRISPLEDTIVALRPIAPSLPFAIPNSYRLIDPTKAEGDALTGGPGGFFDPLGNPITVINHYVNYGWEYVWHCHILSHEEMDMMHSMVVGVPPVTVNNLAATLRGATADLTWTDRSLNEVRYIVEKRELPGTTWTVVGTINEVPGVGSTVTYRVSNIKNKATTEFRVKAANVVGDSALYDVEGVPTQVFPVITIESQYSNIVSVTR